jgi:hypothetical protein
MNHRALPSYFGFSAAKLTIVVASEDLAIGPVGPIGAQAGASSAAPGTQGAPAGGAQLDRNRTIAGLVGAAACALLAGASKPEREQAQGEAVGVLTTPGRGRLGACCRRASQRTVRSDGRRGRNSDSASGPAGGGACGRRSWPGSGCSVRAGQGRHRRHPARHVARRGHESDQAHSPGIRIDETRGIVSNVATTDYLCEYCRGAQLRRIRAAIGDFPPPPTPRAPSSSNASPAFPRTSTRCSDAEQALVEKYGPPSFGSEGVMLWTFNAAGVQIVDNNVNARCANTFP